ncbi:c-type cytochrome [Methylonatrum kenyense]|uniref:c-type cytochrome n=1 Tax=Methylonatrum kenyense TaxID=455253 RepID=UPI0020C0247D|nr:c-type cytochrome [Methylonatrum kenyense]MCK8515982.1 c-type cytochrome [Methylonatrum kenyense]
MRSLKVLSGTIAGMALGLSAAHADAPDPDGIFDEVSRGDAGSIVESNCMQCHGAGVMGAAGVGEDYKETWQGLVEARGYDGLYDSVLNGRGAMPARGGQDISDEEVAAALVYMLTESGVGKDDIK